MSGLVVIERFVGSELVSVSVGGLVRSSRLPWAEALVFAAGYAGAGATVWVEWRGERRGPRGYERGVVNRYRVQLPRDRKGVSDEA